MWSICLQYVSRETIRIVQSGGWIISNELLQTVRFERSVPATMILETVSRCCLSNATVIHYSFVKLELVHAHSE
jgi:hypothetical protein